MKQLQFSWNVSALPGNLAFQCTNPRPIKIEKLKQPGNRKDQGAGDGLDVRNSVEFSIVSEENLHRAVQLAKRDVKRRHLEEQVRQHLLSEDKIVPAYLREPGQTRRKEPEGVTGPGASNFLQKDGRQLGNCSKLETTSSGAKVYLYTPNGIKSNAAASDSPPTHDPGPGPRKEDDKTALEVRRLQKELQNQIQKIEELAKKGEGDIAVALIVAKSQSFIQAPGQMVSLGLVSLGMGGFWVPESIAVAAIVDDLLRLG